ncbi:MAG: Fic family protein [Candidatus Methanomethylophilaceae archaeon]|nr:Fic family protein [Candidatus Methanomethylophilaceae archaeon]
MRESDFKGTITGEVRRVKDGSYRHFHPYDLPFDWMCSLENLYRVDRASIELARLDGMMRFIDDGTLEMLISNLSLRESVSSSSIEGTRSTLDDAFRSEKIGERDGWRSRDNQEIVNYRKAILYGFERLTKGEDITMDMIRDLHRVLMQGVRGSDKSPGEFKTRQNAIGMASDTLETAKMVPASQESVDHLIDNWLEYVNSDSIATVEKLAISHYQFEAIHPFMDGNGRVGRLLMLMILHRDGLLRQPVLHLSGYLDSNRDRYIDLMYRVSSEDALDEWLGFITEALEVQARSTASTVEALVRYRERLRSAVGSVNAARSVDLLFKNPYITNANVAEGIGVSRPTAEKVIAELEEAGIIREVTGKMRNRVYRADGVLEILR